MRSRGHRRRVSSKKEEEEIVKKSVTEKDLLEPDLSFKLPDQFCSCARSKPEVNTEWEEKYSRSRVKRSPLETSRSKDMRDRIVGGYDAVFNKVCLTLTHATCKMFLHKSFL